MWACWITVHYTRATAVLADSRLCKWRAAVVRSGRILRSSNAPMSRRRIVTNRQSSGSVLSYGIVHLANVSVDCGEYQPCD